LAGAAVAGLYEKWKAEEDNEGKDITYESSGTTVGSKLVQTQTTSRKWDAYKTLFARSRNDPIMQCIGATLIRSYTHYHCQLPKQGCAEIRAIITGLETLSPDFDTLCPFLPILAILCLCERYHKQQAPEVIEKWVAELKKVSKDVDALPLTQKTSRK
jgi:hypothetical protein